MSKRDKITDQQKLQKYLELVDKLPSAPPPVLLPEHDPLNMECLCGKFKTRTSMPVRDSGIVRFRDTVCHGCHKEKKKQTCSDYYAQVPRAVARHTPTGNKI